MKFFTQKNNKGFILLNFPKTKSSGGFTLIELMVSISIFAIIMVISMGAVLSITEANRKSRTLKSSMNNLNFVVDSIARNIKFGTDWTVTGGTDCASNIGINFIDKFSIEGVTRRVHYRCALSSGIGHIERRIDIVGGATGSFEPITSPEINITKFEMFVSGVGINDIQPFLILSINGVAGSSPSNQTSFDLQTSVSQRDLEEIGT